MGRERGGVEIFLTAHCSSRWSGFGALIEKSTAKGF
jgi:hypothetical protein